MKTVHEPEILRLVMEEQRRALTRIDISSFLDLDDDFWRRARDRSGVVG